MYAEALLAYNRNKIDETARILDEVIRIDPANVPALEMRALTLKIRGDDQKSIEVYRKLIAAKPEKETAAYRFELATIYQKQKKPELARAGFQKSLELGFNVVPSHLFLGTIDFADGKYVSAEDHFTWLKEKSTDEFQVMARYYLGLVHFKAGYGSAGTAEILEARTLADKMPDNPAAQSIGKATEAILAPFSKSQWFVNATSIAQYDSNIAQIPVGITNPEQTSGKSTSKLNLSAGFGRLSAPLSAFQYVGSYRLAYNKNLNDKTKAFEYLVNTGSLYLNYRPLARTTGGIKLEGNFMFQNQLQRDLGPDSYLYGKANLTGEAGLFVKSQVSRRLTVSWDGGYRKVSSYTSSDQSGYLVNTHAAVNATTGRDLLTPGLSLTYERSITDGAAFRYNTFAAGLSNSMRITGKDVITLSVDMAFSSYPEVPGGRSDTNLPFRLNWARTLKDNWSLICDGSYTTNTSSVPDAYSYNRYTLGAGIGWSL